MSKKLTITLNDEIYEGLYKIAGRGHISEFIEALLRPRVIDTETYADLEEGYRQMAADEEREAEAMEWAELDIELDIEDDYSKAR